MGRKVFLSFLGTNDYLNCNYYEDKNLENKIEDVRFIQEALVRLYCKDFAENDRIFIFLTDEARDSNWIDGERGIDKTFKHGLKHQIENLALKTKLEDVDIKEGYSENDIWDIFNVVFSKLKDEDEVLFDITHGFRSLPMLGMVLLNYSKFLKNINLKAIYYGAFEKLGPAYKVKNIDIKDRNAPIIDLIAFDELQQWSVGADNFVNYGNADKIVRLIRSGQTPVLEENTQKEFNSFAKNLDKITKYFLANRGKEIIEGKEFVEIKKSLKNMINKTELNVFKPIFYKLLNDLKDFEENDVLNGIRTVKWCIKHGLLQQGFTALEETITSWILDNSLNDIDVFNYKKYRKPVGDAYYVLQEKNKGSEIKITDNITDEIISSGIISSNLLKLIQKVKAMRNDLNHWGMKPSNLLYEHFKKNLNKSLKEFEKII